MPTVVPTPELTEALPRLRDLPLLAPLSESALESLAHELAWIHLHGGELLFAQGDPGDSLYFVLHGRLEVFVVEGGSERLLGTTSQGETVGEMAILMDAPRTASVRAARDSLLVRLSRESFDRLVAHDAPTLMSLARMIVTRLHESQADATKDRSSTTLTLFGLQPAVDLRGLSRQLAGALSDYRELVIVDRGVVESSFGVGAADTPQSGPLHEQMGAWLHQLEEQHDLLLLVADPTPTEWTFRCLRQADTVMLVAEAEKIASESTLQTLRQHRERTQRRSRSELVLIHDAQHPKAFGAPGWLRLVEPDAHHHIQRGSRPHVERLARHLTGNTTTLVLGGGGARGFAHIGVYRAMLEAGIPIDSIAGSSMGSVMSAMIALGWDPKTMLETTREIFLGKKSIYDVTVPSWSLIEGKRLANSIMRVFGEHTHIEDLWLRYFCVSSNLTRANVEIHDSGPLWHWVRTSGSLPGIAPPVPHNGELLVDGGVLNNLPADIARQRNAGRIIAVNVLTNTNGTTLGSIPRELSSWQVLWRRFHPTAPDRNIPMLGEVLMRTAMLGIAANTAQMRSIVDLLLEPPVESFSILDATPLNRIAELGYRDTLERLRDWKSAPAGVSRPNAA